MVEKREFISDMKRNTAFFNWFFVGLLSISVSDEIVFAAVSTAKQVAAVDKAELAEKSESDEKQAATANRLGMSPKDILQETLHTNPEIKADRSNWRAEDHAIDRAQAGYYPVVDLRAQAGWEYTRESFGRSDCSRIGRKCQENRVANTPSIVARQPLFDGLRASTDVARAQREKEQAGSRIGETQELVSFRAMNAAVDGRRFQRLLRLAIANVNAHLRILNKVNRLIAAGKASIADRHTVESRLADAISAVVDIEGDLGSAVARFIDVVGVAPDRLKPSVIPEGYLPTSVQEALKQAVEQNRSVQLAQSNIEVAKAELSTTDVPFYPTLDLEANARRDGDTEGRNGHETSVTVFLVARYNIFSGGGDVARRKEVAEQVAETHHRREVAVRSAEREVRVSWAELQSAKKQSEALRRSVQEKNKVIQVFEKQFDLGTRSLLDLLDSWNEFFLAKGSLITVDATTDLTGYRLLASMGVLLNRYDLQQTIAGPASEVQPAVARSEESIDLTVEDPVDRIPRAVLEDTPIQSVVDIPEIDQIKPEIQPQPEVAPPAPVEQVEPGAQLNLPQNVYENRAVGQGIEFTDSLTSGEELAYPEEIYVRPKVESVVPKVQPQPELTTTPSPIEPEVQPKSELATPPSLVEQESPVDQLNLPEQQSHVYEDSVVGQGIEFAEFTSGGELTYPKEVYVRPKIESVVSEVQPQPELAITPSPIEPEIQPRPELATPPSLVEQESPVDQLNLPEQQSHVYEDSAVGRGIEFADFTSGGELTY